MVKTYQAYKDSWTAVLGRKHHAGGKLATTLMLLKFLDMKDRAEP